MDEKNLQTIITKLEETSRYVENLAVSVWDVLVFGTQVEGFAGLVLAGIITIVTFIAAQKIIASTDSYDRSEVSLLVYLFGSIIWVMCLVVLYNSAIAAFAPEYSILKALVF